MTGGPEFGLDGADRAPIATAPLPSFKQDPAGGITLRGNGRFGLIYDEFAGGSSDVTLSTRLRVDVDVRHQTDGGVTFGGRIRAQAQTGTGTTVNAPTLYATWD